MFVSHVSQYGVQKLRSPSDQPILVIVPTLWFPCFSTTHEKVLLTSNIKPTTVHVLPVWKSFLTQSGSGFDLPETHTNVCHFYHMHICDSYWTISYFRPEVISYSFFYYPHNFYHNILELIGAH